MPTEFATSAVVGMIDAVRADWSKCAILADALEDAGYSDAESLAELRAESVFGRAPFREAVGRTFAAVLGVEVVRVLTDDSRRASRRTARTVDADAVAEQAAYSALASGSGRWWVVKSGGGVANSYGYAAVTDGVLAAAVCDAAAGRVCVAVWADTLAANKVTDAGIAGLFGFRDLCDGRVSAARKDAAREALFAAVARASEGR